jgi:hypothetical protein
MASIIDASTAGVGGIITTADNSGNLNIQSGGSTKIAVTSAGVAVTGLSKASLPTGSVLQVVQGTSNTFTTSASSTFSDTGLTATITPTSATSKILVIASFNIGKQTGNTWVMMQLVRNSTSILVFEDSFGDNASTTQTLGEGSCNFLDSPATTSATTYKIQFASGANISRVVFNNTRNAPSVYSTITLMEIAA